MQCSTEPRTESNESPSASEWVPTPTAASGYEASSFVSQLIKDELRSIQNGLPWLNFTDVQREALDQLAHSMGMLACHGMACNADLWSDIATQAEVIQQSLLSNED